MWPSYTTFWLSTLTFYESSQALVTCWGMHINVARVYVDKQSSFHSINLFSYFIDSKVMGFLNIPLPPYLMIYWMVRQYVLMVLGEPSALRLHHWNLTAVERINNVLCSVDISRFYVYVNEKRYHHGLFQARTNTVCHLDLWSLDWPAACAPPIANRTN